MKARLAVVVEGHGEEPAAPVLLRRILHEHLLRFDVDVLRPHRVPRSRMTAPEHLGRAVSLQTFKVGGQSGGVLILLDEDDDDHNTLSEQVLRACGPNCADVQVAVAVREYEAWFLASIESLRKHPAVDPRATFGRPPESVRGAKEALSSVMNQPYKEMVHQASFSSLMDLQAAAERSPSFAGLVAAVERLVDGTRGGG